MAVQSKAFKSLLKEWKAFFSSHCLEGQIKVQLAEAADAEIEMTFVDHTLFSFTFAVPYCKTATHCTRSKAPFLFKSCNLNFNNFHTHTHTHVWAHKHTHTPEDVVCPLSWFRCTNCLISGENHLISPQWDFYTWTELTCRNLRASMLTGLTSWDTSTHTHAHAPVHAHSRKCLLAASCVFYRETYSAGGHRNTCLHPSPVWHPCKHAAFSTWNPTKWYD